MSSRTSAVMLSISLQLLSRRKLLIGISAPVYRQCAIPFMDLFDVPKVLPPRLTRLLPHDLAHELRCVPVGRSSRGLTVAMADPTNTNSVQRLEAVTGMTIFPVSCDEDDLNIFLTVNW